MPIASKTCVLRAEIAVSRPVAGAPAAYGPEAGEKSPTVQYTRPLLPFIVLSLGSVSPKKLRRSDGTAVSPLCPRLAVCLEAVIHCTCWVGFPDLTPASGEPCRERRMWTVTIVGHGIDLVEIAEMERWVEDPRDPLLPRCFTQDELNEVSTGPNRIERLAGPSSRKGGRSESAWYRIWSGHRIFRRSHLPRAGRPAAS